MVDPRLHGGIETDGHHLYLSRDVPPKRATKYAIAGEVDGELSRVANYNADKPTLIRVEELNQYVHFMAYATDQTLKFDDWESLRGTSLRVVYRRGIVRSETMLSSIVPAEKLSNITSLDQGIKKLVTHRTDLYIDIEDSVKNYLTTPDVQTFNKGGVKIYEAGLLETTTGHMFSVSVTPLL